jgi:hypothetical protein
MIDILGLKVAVTKKILYTKNTEVVLAYTNAIKKGRPLMEKMLKIK